MEAYRRKNSIKRRIGILMVLFAVLLGGCNIFIIKYKNKLILSNLEEYSQHQMILLEREIAFNFDVLEQVADTITDTKHLENYIDRLNQVAKTNSYWRMGIANINGDGYLDNGQKLNIAKRQYFKESIQGKNYLSSVYKDQFWNIKINTYSVPIFNEEKEVEGIIFLALEADKFTDALLIQLDAPNRYSYIIEADGTLVTDSSISQAMNMTNFFDTLEKVQGNTKDRKKLETDIKAKNSNMFTTYNEEDKYFYYHPLNIGGWYLVTFMTENMLLKQIAPFLTLTRIMMVAFTLIFIAAFLWNLLDVIRHKKQVENMAWLDELTKGKNKAYLKENLFSLIKKEKNQKAILLNININNFRNINDLNSNKIGNRILIKLYQIISSQCQGQEVVVHTYADEFLVIWFYKEIEEIYDRVEYLQDFLSNIKIDKSYYDIQFSTGMVKIDNKCDFDTLYSRSLMARKKCKENEDLSICLFENNLIEELANINKLEKEIKDAIANKEFEAFFQAQVSSDTEKIIGAEALVRWRKKDGTILSPFYFIPYAEQNGLIQQIDEIVFEDVCKKLKECLKNGIEMQVSVNISRTYIKNRAYLHKLKKIADKYRVSTNLIHLEITESGFLDSQETLANIFEEIKQWGFITSLDDFGTGYSSVKTLNDLHFDILKIDKSFVDKIGDKRTDAIIRYTLNMAKSFQMQTIAEGIEKKEQFEFLKRHGCEMIQGYYFAKPVDFTTFLNMLQEKK